MFGGHISMSEKYIYFDNVLFFLLLFSFENSYDEKYKHLLNNIKLQTRNKTITVLIALVSSYRLE